jgi:hypothetical protein
LTQLIKTSNKKQTATVKGISKSDSQSQGNEHRVNTLVQMWGPLNNITSNNFISNYMMTRTFFDSLERLDKKSQDQFWTMINQKQKQENSKLKSIKTSCNGNGKKCVGKNKNKKNN